MRAYGRIYTRADRVGKIRREMHPTDGLTAYQRWYLKHGHEAAMRERIIRNQIFSIPYTAEQLAARFAYWGNRCYLCQRDDVPMTRDHVKPISLGGPDILSNIRPACRSCNSKKANNRLDI